MRLSAEVLDHIKKWYAKCEEADYMPENGLTIGQLLDTIEALQQENEQLKADCDRMLGEVQELTMECNHFKERLQISPYGDDKIDELDEALENCKFQYEQLKLENEQLRAQVTQLINKLPTNNPVIRESEVEHDA